MTKIQLNKPIKNFIIHVTGDHPTLSLADLKGHNVVIYFYPKDNTPGCTSEGLAFRNLYNDFQKANTLIFGISKGTLKSHENFKAKYSFPFELISDPDETLSTLFDVIKLKKLYGKEYLGIERSTFLIDKEGILRQEWRQVKVTGHAEEVLKAAQKLK